LARHVPAAERLTAAFLAGDWRRRALVERGLSTYESDLHWMRRLVARVWDRFGGRRPVDQATALTETVDAFMRNVPLDGAVAARRFCWYAPVMLGVEAPDGDYTLGDLGAWLRLPPEQADRLANRGRHDNGHYRYEWRGRRLLEAPKPRILAGIPEDLPPHPAAVAARPDLSVRDGAAAHVGKRVVVRLDLRDTPPAPPPGRPDLASAGESVRLRARRAPRRPRRYVRRRVTGVVVNAHPNVARADYDRLRAILTNCLRHGPMGQNRGGHPRFRLHLAGRIGWVESLNPRRGARLRALFDRIEWPSSQQGER